MFNHLKSFALLLTVCLGFMAQSAIADRIRVILEGSSTSRTDGIDLSWNVKRQVIPDDGGIRYWTPVIGCDCQIYRDGALIATVKSSGETTHYHDLDVVAGQKYSYVVNAMGENSNTREVTCERNNSKDIYPEVSDDSGVAGALDGSADAKLAENITTAVEYAAYRAWATGLSGVTPQQVKDSPNAWLSYALDTDKLIEGEVTESRLKVTSFKLSGENNLFSIKLKLDGVDIGDAATVENLLKIFAVEGAKELSDDSFSVDNVALKVVQINEGEVEFIVMPRVKGNSYFFRARMRDNANGVGMNIFSDKREKVQLWEGGPYWATTNIGAEKPEDYGYSFWWGDTVGYKRENDKWVASDGSNSNFSFDLSNTPTYGKDNSTLQSEGWITADGVLAPEHDAAKKHWGGDWRMPTDQEFDDLISKCDWVWTSTNGVNGYIVRGKGDYSSVSIFLPAGYVDEPSLYDAGSYGFYWSSVPNSDYYRAWYLGFDSSYHGTDSYGRRDAAHSVRPLQGFTK